MPIYEYECENCGRIEEAWQKFSDAPLTRCDACSGSLHKLISQSAFHLKGSGWYVTDYKKNASSDSKPAESKTDASSSGAKSETGSSDSGTSGASGTSDSA